MEREVTGSWGSHGSGGLGRVGGGATVNRLFSIYTGACKALPRGTCSLNCLFGVSYTIFTQVSSNSVSGEVIGVCFSMYIPGSYFISQGLDFKC